MTSCDLQTTSTLAELVAAASAALGATVTHASFRGEDGRPVTLLSDGAYPAGGALLIGPDATVASVGLDARACLNVQVASKKPKARAPKAKKPAKRRRVGDDDDYEPGDDEDEDAEAGATAAARKILGPRAHAALDGGARAGEDFDAVAASFVMANDAPDSLMGSAAAMWTSQQGAQRVEAAAKGWVRVVPTPATLKIAWRTSKAAKKEQEEVVRRFSPEDSVAVVAAILHRQAGSTRRKLSGDKPSTRLLTPPSVASRCPALFWSLYASSRASDEPDAPGDVVFALDHVLGEAMAKYTADVDALRAAQG